MSDENNQKVTNAHGHAKVYKRSRHSQTILQAAGPSDDAARQASQEASDAILASAPTHREAAASAMRALLSETLAIPERLELLSAMTKAMSDEHAEVLCRFIREGDAAFRAVRDWYYWSSRGP